MTLRCLLLAYLFTLKPAENTTYDLYLQLIHSEYPSKERLTISWNLCGQNEKWKYWKKSSCEDTVNKMLFMSLH